MNEELENYTIPEELDKVRLDKAMSEMIGDLSRSRIKLCIEEGGVKVNGVIVTQPRHKVMQGDEFSIIIPEAEEYDPEPEDIPLDIIYEDNDLLVINKESGMVVHPGAGNYTGTLVNALLHHCKDDLSGIGGIKRPGIVHRLDKETTGLMVVAKNDKAHTKLSAQLADRSLFRLYHAVVLGCPLPIRGIVNIEIGRDPSNRIRMSVRGRAKREATTNYHVIEKVGESFSLLECKLQTGRTHQIRVHMEHIKNFLIGDKIYGPQITAVKANLNKIDASDDLKEIVLNFPRQALHAREIGFIHPETDEEMRFIGEYPDDFNLLINKLF